MKTNAFILSTTCLTTCFLSACNNKTPDPVKPDVQSLSVQTVNENVCVVNVPGLPLHLAKETSDKSQLIGFSFLVAEVNQQSGDQVKDEKNSEMESVFISLSNSQVPYTSQVAKIDRGTYIVQFNGDDNAPSIKVLLLPGTKDGASPFKAVLLRDVSMRPKPSVQPAPSQESTASNDRQGPVFDATNPAHPLHPFNPLNPTNPIGVFAPSPGRSGGK